MSRRSYRQNCALARAADRIGERWTLLLLRDLLIGPRRYSELSRSARGMGTNLLAARLRDMEADGLVRRGGGAGRPSEYELTEAGRALEPAVLALIRWGLAWGSGPVRGDHHQDDWDLLALKAIFNPDRAGDLSMTVSFVAPEGALWCRVARGEVSVGRGELEEPDLVVHAPIAALAADPSGAPIPLTGGRRKLSRFLRLFEWPER